MQLKSGEFMCSLNNCVFIFQKQQSSIKLVVNGSLPFLGMDIIRNQESFIPLLAFWSASVWCKLVYLLELEIRL